MTLEVQSHPKGRETAFNHEVSIIDFTAHNVKTTASLEEALNQFLESLDQ